MSGPEAALDGQLPLALRPWRGSRGNREVPPQALGAGCAARGQGEGGSWGKQGFPHGTERPARMPDAEDV